MSDLIAFEDRFHSPFLPLSVTSPIPSFAHARRIGFASKLVQDVGLQLDPHTCRTKLGLSKGRYAN
ncbi:hypothetical protein BU24DRAFT_419341 [Aaosphaeria arxii CBS 175.79]|uniref:Uncharacterized protein n=1 Tax=Aaosphaeria arxii CBS 175.79 TaxID=1450172 RepID=A0A6A5Y2F2_9PLEO|nr:uncharacterized protein BU24DRAFT_419341 [Aaosphaeria arxii CBS 175.79]KAF2019712.1 hypothetical protein BU24DRAFT_419341 [Aaosphaeria arxii CBS 175.79]